MKHKKTANIPSKIIEVVDFVTCDMCGVRITRTPIDVDEVTIEYKKGKSFPDGSTWGERISVDFCLTCFENDLMGYLESRGINPSIEKWDS